VCHVLPPATPRLRFREMTEADLADIASLERGGARSPADWIAWNLDNYAEHGFGLWIVETHAGEFVGDCGLTMQEVEGAWLVEAGWHIRADRRQAGLATEAALAVRDAARDAGLQHLIAIVRPDNVASQRVAAKIGMVLEREVHKNGRPAWVFGVGLSG
jgi:RimJ/RimL family protein N-acetyltransferase